MVFQVPFSSRNKIEARQISDDFPDTGRIGLLHLIRDLIEREYIQGWQEVIRELQRLARTTPVEYPNCTKAFYLGTCETLIMSLSWQKVFDFCERLHSYLAKDVGYYEYNDFTITTPISEVREFIGSELQRLFWEEGLTFEFTEGLVQRRGRKHTVEIVTKSQMVLADSRLISARKHYNKALQFFRSRSKPDFENTVKEAVCAVEAGGKALFPEAKATTLGDLIKWLTLNDDVNFPKSIAQTLAGLYAFRNSGEGVGHGGAAGGAVTAELAEYVLSVAASQIILLYDLATSDEDLPF